MEALVKAVIELDKIEKEVETMADEMKLILAEWEKRTSPDDFDDIKNFYQRLCKLLGKLI